jgi:serine/threonine protein kinase
MVWDLGKTIKDGQYRIQEVLGEGRFGITYRASDKFYGLASGTTPPQWQVRDP